MVRSFALQAKNTGSNPVGSTTFKQKKRMGFIPSSFLPSTMQDCEDTYPQTSPVPIHTFLPWLPRL